MRMAAEAIAMRAVLTRVTIRAAWCGTASVERGVRPFEAETGWVPERRYALPPRTPRGVRPGAVRAARSVVAAGPTLAEVSFGISGGGGGLLRTGSPLRRSTWSGSDPSLSDNPP
jgi:hypothetical protein